MIRKAPMAADKFIASINDDEWAEIAQSSKALLHTRAQTKGDPNKNVNNHPVTGFNWLVTHNGTVYNDDDLFDYTGEVRPAEVDSIAIPLALSRGTSYEDSIHQSTLLAGTATFAAWSLEAPERLALVRLGSNELWLFYDEARSILYWSSAAMAGQVMPSKMLGSIVFLTMGKLHDERALLLSPDRTGTRTFKLTRNPFTYRKPKALPPPAGTPSIPRDSVTSPGTHRSDTKDSTWMQASKWRWEQTDKKTRYPAPMVEEIRPRWLYIDEIERELKGNPGLGYYSLRTPYGTWSFSLNRVSGVVERNFRPCKRLKDFYYNTYKEKPSLPVYNEAEHTWWDNRETLQIFSLVDGSATISGRLCPWCGISMPSSNWHTHLFRCPFCLIKSKPPLMA